MIAMAVAAVLAGAGCGKSKGAGGGSAGGGFDNRSLQALQDRVGSKPIAEAGAAVEQQFGPARAKDATLWDYAAIDGGRCYHFGLLIGGDGTVHGVQQSDARTGDAMYADCEKLAKSPAVK